MNAGACFQKVMDDALAHHPNAKCHIDDVLMYNTTIEKHLGHIRQAFDSIAAMGLKSHTSKCVFGAQEVLYLGHLLSASGVRPMEAKIETIVEMRAPVDVSGCGPLWDWLATIGSLCQTSATSLSR